MWHRHPAVRTGDQLTFGERSADRMRNSMGSWAFVFSSLVFLGVWMTVNTVIARHGGHAFDAYPFILLNLVLSCIAALQGAILLIAAKRSDQVSSELASHDYRVDTESRQLLDELRTDYQALAEQHRAQGEQLAQVLQLLQERS